MNPNQGQPAHRDQVRAGVARNQQKQQHDVQAAMQGNRQQSARPAVRRTILLRGPVPPTALAAKLQDHGVAVEPWAAPEEDRGIAHDIVVSIIASGVYDAIKSGLEDFLRSFPDADAHIEDDDDRDASENDGEDKEDG